MAARTKRGRSGSTVPTGATPVERVLASASNTPLVKLAAKTMLYSAVNLRAGQDEKNLEESELWQSFEALVVAKRGVPFDRTDSDTDWKVFLGENGFDTASSQRMLDLLEEAASKRTQVSVCEFFTTSSAIQGEHKSANRVFEYQLRKALSLVPRSVSAQAEAIETLPRNDDLDTSHLKAADARLAALMVQTLDNTEAHGWQVEESVILRLPHVLDLMHLIDDDKKAGLSQMLLTDMFTKMSLRPSPAVRTGVTSEASC